MKLILEKTSPFDGIEWNMIFDGDDLKFTTEFHKRTPDGIEITKRFRTGIGCFKDVIQNIRIDMKRPNTSIDLSTTMFDGVSFNIKQFTGDDMVAIVVYEFEKWQNAIVEYNELSELYEWGRRHLDKVVLA